MHLWQETDAAQAHALARREDIFAAIKACPLSKTSCSAKIPALAAHKGWLPALDGKGASDVQSAMQDVQGKIIHCQGLIRTCKAALKVLCPTVVTISGAGINHWIHCVTCQFLYYAGGPCQTCSLCPRVQVGHHYLDAVLEELFYARQSKSEVQQLLAQRKESLKGIAKLNNQWTFIEQHIQQLKHQLSDLQAQSQH